MKIKLLKINMGQRRIISVFATLIFIISILISQVNYSEAVFNKQINYQGKLTLSSGVAVSNGTYAMEFKLYTVDTGGTAIWTETRTGGDEVTVSNGLFSVMLGEVNPFTTENFNQTLYLGVKIEGDAEMTPRKKLGAVPASIEAEHSATATKSTNLVGGNSTTLLGSIPYQSNTDTTSFVNPNTTIIKKFFTMTGTGTNGAIPSWEGVTATDVGLGSVTNESKATMFTSPTFTGTVAGFTMGGDLVLGANTFTTINTGLVTNLNADLLDGQHGSYYATASSLGSYVSYTGATANVNLGAFSLTAYNFSGNSSGTNTGDNATNSQYSGLAASKADVNQTMYIGTTAHALNRASAAEGLAGITSLTPGANFTLSQNAVNVFTSEETGAVANTLYLKNGNVGIGTTTPAATLDINGNGIANSLNIINSTSQTTATTYGLSNTLTQTAGNSAHQTIGTFNSTTYSGSGNEYSVTGTKNYTYLNTTGTVAYSYGDRSAIFNNGAVLSYGEGVEGNVINNSGTLTTGYATVGNVTVSGGKFNKIVGVYSNVTNASSDVTNNDAYGFYSSFHNSGVFDGYAGLQIDAYNTGTARILTGLQVDFWTAGGTTQELRGIDIGATHPWTGTPTNSYGIYIDASTNIGTSTNYSIYSASTANSYFAGNVGIGTTAPTARLTVSDVTQIRGGTSPAWPSTGAGVEFAYDSNDTGWIGEVTGQSVIQSIDRDTLLYKGLILNAYDFSLNPSGTVGINIKNNGNVGIGTTAPLYKLVVSNGGAAGLELDPTGTAFTGGVAIQAYDRNASAYKDLNIQNGNGNIILKDSGNVGIGTTGPTAPLTVAALTSGTDQSILYLRQDATNDYGWKFNVDNTNTGNVYFQRIHAGAEMAGAVVTYTDSGNVGIGTTNPWSLLSVSATSGYPAIDVGLNGTHKGGMNYDITNDVLQIQTTGNLYPIDFLSGKVRIQSNGNVGIGTVSPNNLFEVSKTSGAAVISLRRDQNVLISQDVIGSVLFSSNDGNLDGSTYPWDIAKIDVISSASAGSVGTDMRFFTNYDYLTTATEKMRIDRNGNVGIGTTTPGSLLDIQMVGGGAATQSTMLNLAYSNARNTTNDELSIDFKTYSNTIPLARISGWNESASGNTGGLKFYTTPGGTLSSTPAVTILGNGNVGIGTTDPAGYKLNVDGGSIRVGNGASTDGIYIGAIGYTASILYDNPTGNLSINPRSGYSTIIPNGNVGIGTTDPSAKLHANGNISTGLGSGIVKITNDDAYSSIAIGMDSGANYNPFIQSYTRQNNSAWNLSLNPYGGNVGIGTTNPGAKLEIAIDPSTALIDWSGSGVTNGLIIRSNDPGTTGNASLSLISTGLGNNHGASITNIPFDNSGSQLAFYTNPNNIYANLVEAMRIDDNGNVGIGTTNPGAKLDISTAYTSDMAGAVGLAIRTTDAGAADVGGTLSFFGKYNATNSIFQAGIHSGLKVVNESDAYMAFSVYQSSVGPSEKMRIQWNGNVGIGTVSPGYKLETSISDAGTNTVVYPLSVSHYSSGTSAAGFGSGINFASQSFAGAGIDVGRIRTYQDASNVSKMTFSTIYGFNTFVDAMTIYNGNVGIGTTNPGTFKLQVAGNIGPDATNSYDLGAAGSSFGCLYYNSGTLGTCASDERLKTNITDVNFGTSSALTQVSGLRPRTFSFRSDKSADLYNGLIAQEVEQVAPELVVTNADGFKAVKYGDVQWLTLEALQELNLKVEDLSSLDTTSATSLGSLITSFLGNETARIGKIFAKTIDTETLCVSDGTGAKTCINKAQLDDLLASAGESGGSESSSPLGEGAGGGGDIPLSVDENLAKAKTDAEALTTESYTTESWSTFTTALATAQELLEENDEDKIAKTTAINDAVTGLELLVVEEIVTPPTCELPEILYEDFCVIPAEESVSEISPAL